MKCPEIAPLIQRFFDGELDGASMRKIALHITRCAGCERDLRALERVQGLVIDHVAAAVDKVDLDSIWAGVSARIEARPRSWWQRVEAWWDDVELWSPTTVWPAAAAAAAVFLAVNLWSVDPSGTAVSGHDAVARDEGVQIDELVGMIKQEHLYREVMQDFDKDNSAVFESIVGGVDTLMVEPKTQTAVIWINDNGELR